MVLDKLVRKIDIHQLSNPPGSVFSIRKFDLRDFMTGRHLRRQVYLDYQGSTPVDPRVVDAMEPWWTSIPANPHASHALGVEAGMGAIAESW